MFEKLSDTNRHTAAAIALASSLALTGCALPGNFSGEGNGFVIEGTVSDSETDGLVQLSPDSLVVIDSDGEAVDWFSGNDEIEYDFLQHYNDDQPAFAECGNEIVVGNVFDSQGEEINPEDLDVGDTVRIEGSIHDSQYRLVYGKQICGTEQLAVYDTIEVIG